ncbi:hypothetical protein L1987_55801 [Smallanthus sonchifolius]|uniref:Uncharacterized protein n=1 Tax=Smallanthus sonchifolius TaxID=185202 RepID=A0ACB9EBE3_9ASTR|nr:hypothetical protein L1987_55801 [Smallanthus sonchifolius]
MTESAYSSESASKLESDGADAGARADGGVIPGPAGVPKPGGSHVTTALLPPFPFNPFYFSTIPFLDRETFRFLRLDLLHRNQKFRVPVVGSVITQSSIVNHHRMKAGSSSLNPYATSYIPLSKREIPDASKGYDQGSTTQYQSPGFSENHDAVPESHDNLKLKNHSGFDSCGSSSNSSELAGKQALDVDHDMNLTYLQMVFPGVSDESLSSVYTACGGDMEATVDMLNELELHSDDFTENLPDSLDIGDVSEAGSSTEGGSQKLKKVVVGEDWETACSCQELFLVF